MTNTDLIERLKAEAAMLREIATSPARGVDWAANLAAGADAFVTAAAALTEANARVAKAREGLKAIEAAWIANNNDNDNDGDEWEDGYDDGLKAACDLARATLAELEDGR